MSCAVNTQSSRIGTLFLIVGPSGAGKDSVLRAASNGLAGNSSIVFMRRYITRDPEPSEDHVALSLSEFEQGQAEGTFALSWQANGLQYAIGNELNDVLADGRSAVCSVSRTIVATARRNYPKVVAVEITAPLGVRADRLVKRSRESQDQIASRLARSPIAADQYEPELVIDNSATLDLAVRALLAALTAPAVESI